MSVDFRLTTDDPPTRAVFDTAMKAVGLREERTEDTTKRSFCITDGNGDYLWVYPNPDGSIAHFTKWGLQDGVYEFLDRLATELKTTVLNEHDEGFFS